MKKLKRIEIEGNYLTPAYEAFHNYLNCSEAVSFDKIDLSLIDNLEEYFYRVMTKMNKSLFIYQYAVDKLYKDYNIEYKDLYMFGDTYVLVYDD